MVEIVWTETALNDLDAIADYVAFDKPEAARALVQRIIAHVEELAVHPDSGSKPAELSASRYRQIVESPCSVLYRCEGNTLYIVYVMRGGRQLTKALLSKREPGKPK